ncbi:GntR family transcriptional regulator [Microbulbifer thermotolerans]|uniref:GntR family transcriptional regulator n=1 Tax=Microbulbifer thermotolerans TaxID=252514 RepID=A0A143HKS1_MICTH|nr:GntR family transcriptional regulator [Microbulbifer thermotolerans]AMX02325.1 GntR family transcriptional regulator [Microbulbifer thermotolerans]MCX2780036.1 GntR family transcriptional regulator [Microbulbifer thermotolerans]MCX2781767.1 GntR family transcriptional regulator [Microbulbifer thermotolerans]MCX2795108.1 GntR family transcriptional regulator [Microbulbifer thermotolerans]MCX2801863.1 GntR family transcriptional regulator [Microbulbifer thermotolerans]
MSGARELGVSQEEFRTTQEWVYHQVREAILRGKFLPGHPVTIRGLAAELGCSPMPVREALRRLTSERALELSDTRRVTVPTMTPEKLAEICAARVALECQAAERALPYVGPDELERLRSLDDRVSAALADGDTEAYVTANLEFHFTLYRLGRPHIILSLIESLWLQTAPLQHLVFRRFGVQELPDRHRDLLEAISAGDPVRVRTAIRQDIEEGLGSISAEELL